jgi:nicotinamide riboside kinase
LRWLAGADGEGSSGEHCVLVPTSGTASRREGGTMSRLVRRIAIIGAECVGKTELAQELAERLPGLWIPEYLREFCDRRARTPRLDEQLHILAEQQAREEAAIARARAGNIVWVLADSAPLVTAAYSELLFCDLSLNEPAMAHHACYDATLLLLPDLPWFADGIQRDGPAVRDAFHELLLQRLQQARLPFVPIGGVGDVRWRTALEFLRPL